MIQKLFSPLKGTIIIFSVAAAAALLLAPGDIYSQSSSGEPTPASDTAPSDSTTLIHDDEGIEPGQISLEPIDMSAFLVADAAAQVDPSERHIKGEFSDLISWENGSQLIHATHAAALPDGSFVTWHNVFNGIMRTEFTDPTSEAFTKTDISYGLGPGSGLLVNGDVTGFFCPGFNVLPDGRLMGVGGNFNGFHKDTLIYDPNVSNVTNAWSRIEDTEYVRYYGNLTQLGNGDMLMFGGQYNDQVGGADAQITNLPEVFNEENGWRTLNDAPHFLDHNWYHWTQQAPDGHVFYAGPQYDTYSLDVEGEGSWTKLQTRDAHLRTYGSYAVYNAAQGSMLIAGGKSDVSINALENADIVDMNDGDRVATNPLNNNRRMGDLTIMADGKVLMTGGISRSNLLTDYNFGVLTSEIWDPQTKTWTEVDSIAHPRQYHSSAILMKDGRIFKGGGGPCAGLSYCDDPSSNDPTNDEVYDAEIYYPPYLYNEDGSWATRPEITTAPENISHGETFVIQSPDAGNIAKAHLIKLGMSTHSQDMGQRLVPLSFSGSGGQLVISSESTINPNVAVPGHYWLFIVDINGVPSIGHTINVGGYKELFLNSPGNQETDAGDDVSLPISINNPDGASLSFSAENLPPGLEINGENGLITGIPTTGGTYDVTVSAQEGNETVSSISFDWTIEGSLQPTATPTLIPTLTPTSTPTLLPTLTPLPTSTPAPTVTSDPTVTPDPTATNSPNLEIYLPFIQDN